MKAALILSLSLLLLSGCELSMGNRYQVHMAQERPTILLDSKSGKTWVNTACPENPNEYTCWQVMKYDQQPEAGN
jgi:hypothetical protein